MAFQKVQQLIEKTSGQSNYNLLASKEEKNKTWVSAINFFQLQPSETSVTPNRKLQVHISESTFVDPFLLLPF